MAELDPVKLSAMTAASALHLADLFYVGVADAGSETGYFSRKAEAQDVAESFFDDFEFPLKLTETSSARVFGAINEVAKKGNVYIGTCDTAAGTAAKAVTISADQNFKLKKGTMIAVKFTNSNTASSVTFSVNSGTAYPVYYNNGTYSLSNNNVLGVAGRYSFYVFDGSFWVWSGMSYFYSYSNMTQAEAEAATVGTGRLVPPTVLKQAIQYHAIPQIDGGERIVGALGADTLYEKVFTFSYSDMQGGSRDNSRINGVFVLDNNVTYDKIMISDAQIVNTAPDNTFNVWSMPLPIASTSGVYCRVQIQKSYAEPPAYDGVPFIFFDTTYNAAQLKDNNNILYVFTIRYTKGA